MVKGKEPSSGFFKHRPVDMDTKATWFLFAGSSRGAGKSGEREGAGDCKAEGKAGACG